MKTTDDAIILQCGDCRKLLKNVDSDSVQLAIFSPPYAERRKASYGGVKATDYVQWFVPIAKELFRVLKPTGTMMIDIKEHVENGERHTYVIELIQALRSLGFKWTEQFVWAKSNAMPGRWPNRFRDSWERLLQFNKQRHFDMFQSAVMVKRKESTAKRVEHLSENDCRRMKSQTGSTFGKNMSRWAGREMVYPSNVLYMATETQNKGHSAVFPERLPEFFVKLFTQEGDLVLDPFAGSGTVAVVCKRLNRRFLGMEILPEYVTLAQKRIVSTH